MYPVHQLRKPKATIAVVASLMLLLLVLVSIGAALHQQHRSRLESESLYLEIARLFAANSSIDDMRGPVTAKGSYRVISAEFACSP
ncbi:hypothetical protein MRX96_000982 [Rhipicephalus microplus]